MDKSNSNSISATSEFDIRDCKSQFSSHGRCSRGAGDRQKLVDSELDSLLKSLREKETKVNTKLKENDVAQIRLKEIRQERDNTIHERKRIDDEIKLLNNDMSNKRDSLMKLQGSLQYRSEEGLNEAIRRLELQLATHNYKVAEEKKIVQEIDRLRRSKKTVREYLTVKDEIDETRKRQTTMRVQRDTLYRRVPILKADADETNQLGLAIRTEIDQLKKEIDELHDRKRKMMQSEVKQNPVQSQHPAKEPHDKRPPLNLKRRPNTQFAQFCNKATMECLGARRKERYDCKGVTDACSEKEQMYITLAAYLKRLAVGTTYVAPPYSQPTERIAADPAEEIKDGETVMFLHKRDANDGEALCSGQKFVRSGKKGKKDKKKVQHKPLSHTPEVLEQFFKLGLRPPCLLADVSDCLAALADAKTNLLSATAVAEKPNLPCSQQYSNNPDDKDPPKPTTDEEEASTPTSTVEAPCASEVETALKQQPDESVAGPSTHPAEQSESVEEAPVGIDGVDGDSVIDDSATDPSGALTDDVTFHTGPQNGTSETHNMLSTRCGESVTVVSSAGCSRVDEEIVVKSVQTVTGCVNGTKDSETVRVLNGGGPLSNGICQESEEMDSEGEEEEGCLANFKVPLINDHADGLVANVVLNGEQTSN